MQFTYTLYFVQIGMLVVTTAYNTYTYIHTVMCTYIQSCVHTYIPTYSHVYIHTVMCTYIHTYIQSCVHTNHWWMCTSTVYPQSCHLYKWALIRTPNLVLIYLCCHMTGGTMWARSLCIVLETILRWVSTRTTLKVALWFPPAVYSLNIFRWQSTRTTAEIGWWLSLNVTVFFDIFVVSCDWKLLLSSYQRTSKLSRC